MKNQTAVDWLIQELNLHGYDLTIQIAKEMEKEHQRLIYEGLIQNVGTSVKISDLPTFEQYYNQTYNL